MDAVTGATAKYFANKGLMYTYRDGKRVDHLPAPAGVVECYPQWAQGQLRRRGRLPGSHVGAHGLHFVPHGQAGGRDAVNRKLKNVSDAELAAIGML